MIRASVAYVLCRIEDDASLTPVSQHGDVLTGIAAAGHAVERAGQATFYLPRSSSLWLASPSSLREL